MSAHALELAGSIAAAVAVGVSLLADDRRLRAVGLIAAMGLALALVAGQGWDELAGLRDHPPAFAGAALAGIVVLGAGAAFLLHRPLILPLALVAALPFRIPIGVGSGSDVNLLVPLYAVLGAGVLAEAVAAWRAEDHSPVRVPRPLAIALLAAVSLYAVQAIYSDDIPFAARNMGFFLVPFAVMFSLLAEVRWSPRLLKLAFGVVIAEGVVFALIGVGQHIAGDIFWNEKLQMSNDFHFYLRVNSLFWDPNIYGRYLAIAIVVTLGVLVWTAERGRALALGGVIAVLFAGLCVAFSQTSFLSLLAGVAVLCALRWSFIRTAIAVPIVIAIALVGLLTVGNPATSTGPNINTEGRSTLIGGGIDLAKERPVWGHGSGSFSQAFAAKEDVKKGENTFSHNEPVTVAAEQGAIGILIYLSLLGIAVWTLLSGLRRFAPGIGGDPPRGADELSVVAARIAIVSAFVALLLHTIGYAGYLSDPLTWALLAVGGALAVQAGTAPRFSRSP